MNISEAHSMQYLYQRLGKLGADVSWRSPTVLTYVISESGKRKSSDRKTYAEERGQWKWQ